jgi:hypothetical protein
MNMNTNPTKSPIPDNLTGHSFFIAKIKPIHHKLSRKKAQGRARKAANVIFTAKHPDPNGCQHFCYPEDVSPGDVEMCRKLLTSFEQALSATLGTIDVLFDLYELHKRLCLLALEQKNGYHQLSQKGKSLFKRMNISLGTEALLVAPDYVQNNNMGVLPFALMIQAIEFWDEHGYMIPRQDTLDAMWLSMRDITHCPRLMVRFFHRRNTCHCLQQTYYTLKETTKRTTYCCGCLRVKDIHEMMTCDCNLVQYCSRACQLAQWDGHKDYCKAEQIRKRIASNMCCK